MMNDGDKLIKSRISGMEEGAKHIPFDKEAAWMRLHERLASDRAPKGIKLSWRWAVAAAILLMLVSIIALWERPAEEHIAHKEKVQVPIIIPAPHTRAPIVKEAPVVINQPQQALHKMAAGKVAAKREAKPVIIAPLPVIAPAAIADKQPETAKEIAVASKMKVVHINEIGVEEKVNYSMKNEYAGSKSILFFRPSMQTSYTEDLDYRSRNPLKTIFTQN